MRGVGILRSRVFRIRASDQRVGGLQQLCPVCAVRKGSLLHLATTAPADDAGLRCAALARGFFENPCPEGSHRGQLAWQAAVLTQ